jgi:predicted transcriptional regulator of viral defense system
MSNEALTDGLQRKRIDGVEVPIFNPARTVVDCFKYVANVMRPYIEAITA